MKLASIPFNQNKTGWSLNDQDDRRYPQLIGNIYTDWLIIGAGFSGVAFANRLANLNEKLKIVIIDSASSLESSSARNSGFIIGLPHNISSSMAELKKARDYRLLLQEGIHQLEKRIKENNIQCEWEKTGKFHCQISPSNEKILKKYINHLANMQEPYELLNREALYEKLGTRIYSKGIYTPSCILVNPAKLITGLARHLPNNVSLYSDTPALAIRHTKVLNVITPQGNIIANNVMLATNIFSKELAQGSQYQVSMASYASLTEPLTLEQRQRLPPMQSWGVTPINAIAGATLRYTSDHRFLIRQHVEPALKGGITAGQTWHATQQHLEFFRKAYPQLQDVSLANSWSGTISVTRNGAPVWGQLSPHIWIASGCNGSGISKQTIAGSLLAELAMGYQNPLITSMQTLGKANYIPPSPLLNVAISTVLWKERYLGRKER